MKPGITIRNYGEGNFGFHNLGVDVKIQDGCIPP